MNITKHYALLLTMLFTMANTSIQAKAIEVIEDPYSAQAPPEIITIAEKAAALMDFTDAFEVAMPKKAGILVNPWNKFIGHGINPHTKRPLIIVNPGWFMSLPSDQQEFLLGRSFIAFKSGLKPLSNRVLPYIFALFSLILKILVFLVLGKTRFVHYKKWARALIAIGIVMIADITILNKVCTKLQHYERMKFNNHNHQLVIEKTSNNEAAIKALEALDAAIKKELQDDPQFWTPFATLFETFANTLKNKR